MQTAPRAASASCLPGRLAAPPIDSKQLNTIYIWIKPDRFSKTHQVLKSKTNAVWKLCKTHLGLPSPCCNGAPNSKGITKTHGALLSTIIKTTNFCFRLAKKISKKMKKSILKNLLALTFALGALVFVAGNVTAGQVVDEIVLPEVVITCHQHAISHRWNKCFIQVPRHDPPFGICLPTEQTNFWCYGVYGITN